MTNFVALKPVHLVKTILKLKVQMYVLKTHGKFFTYNFIE